MKSSAAIVKSKDSSAFAKAPILGNFSDLAAHLFHVFASILFLTISIQATAQQPGQLRWSFVSDTSKPVPTWATYVQACKFKYATDVESVGDWCEKGGLGSGPVNYLPPIPPSGVGEWGGVFFCMASCGPPGHSTAIQYNFGISGNFCSPGNPQSVLGCGLLDPDFAKGFCPWCVGNPINALFGNKVEAATDYVEVGPFPLTFTRVYNSWGAAPGALMGFYPKFFEPGTSSGQQNWTTYTPSYDSNGSQIVAPIMQGANSNSQMDAGWRHNYDRVLMSGLSSNGSVVYMIRGDSKVRKFTFNGTTWQAYPGQLSTSLTMQGTIAAPTGWTYVNENDETEQYDIDGRLLSITNRAGLTQTLQYDPTGTSLASVTDPFGRQMLFTYNVGGQLMQMTAPDGGTYTYGYGGSLESVTYPDGNIRRYVYDGSGLTGVIDENGNRFATWEYDSDGNAISSQHANGVELVNLTFPSAYSSTSLDAGGFGRAFTTTVINGIPLATSVVETCKVGCNRSISLSYDTNGNVSSKTDYNGVVTNYAFDQNRDLETSRTEAAGTAQSRTITTGWNPTFRLPTQISEPGRTTTFNYDTSGNLLSKNINANGTNRTWTYTYNGNGQVLTATSPRTDVNSMTSYAYDNYGNLASITNALNQVTRFSNYDANGRVGLITDPNGATTTLTYAPRGWLTKKVVTAGNVVQSTVYSYDNVGQLLQVTLPDNSTISYAYDTAHRLTNIRDSLGNSISYTLDAMSNRTGEAVTDPNGVLTRQVSRVFDSLNRVQQVTGAAQ